jgi:predicted TIM-barrel fold metal-dependent hydrolase
MLNKAPALLFWLAISAAACGAEPLPVFDAHLHYNEEAAARYPVAQALEVFRKNGVKGVLANSRPNDGTRALYDAEVKDIRVVPFIRPYIVPSDVQTWFRDPKIYALIESEMKRGYYRGIGEFHLHGADAGGAQVRRIVDLAVANDFVLHAHSDDEAIELLFAHNPRVKIIWAHTGFGTPVEKLELYFTRYPALTGELSYRSGVTGGDGKLMPEWRRLFEKYPDRFLLGSDTWITERWDAYAQIIAGYRGWLSQLPREAAERIAFRNAERLFAEPAR